MERMTHKETPENRAYVDRSLVHLGWYSFSDEEYRGPAIDRLAAYEDICFDADGKERITIEELAALVKALKEGRVTAWPKELWAVRPNPGSNEWNNEPEYHIVHYFVHAFEPETGRYFVNTDNCPGLKQRHWVKGNGLYKSRAEAEAALGGGGDG